MKSNFPNPSHLIFLAFLSGALAGAASAQEGPVFKPSPLLKKLATLREIRRGDSTPLARARAIYPEFKSQALLARYANWRLRTQAHKAVLGAAAEQAETLRDFKPIPGTSLTYEQTPHLHFYNPARLISTSTMVYAYTGGAHGMYGTVTQNYGVVAGESRPRELRLADFFESGFNYRAQIDARLIARLRAQTSPEATWVRMGEVKTVGDYLGNFAVENDGLRWFFPPYAVGPYAAGEFDVKLSFAELGPKFKKSWILTR